MAPAQARQITLDEVKLAVEIGSLPALAQRLVAEHAWVSLGILLAYAGGQRVALDLLVATARQVAAALAGASAEGGGGAAAVAGIRGARHAAAEAILRRVGHGDAGAPPGSPRDGNAREALGVAGGLLLEAGEPARAALTFERADDDLRAAEAYGAVGDIDRMEACLARDERRTGQRRAAADVVRRFELLLAAGEREAAVRAAAGMPEGSPDTLALREKARSVEARLIRQRAVTLRFPGRGAVRLAGVPAILGRDSVVEVPVRDAGSSRRHAAIVPLHEGLGLEDVGSRAGTRLDGLPIAACLPLRGRGEITLGRDCRLAFREIGEGRIELRGVGGLDRDLHAVVGLGPLPLGDLAAAAGDTALEMDRDRACVRLARQGGARLRVAGHLVGAGCDLLHGDVIELEGDRGSLIVEVD